MKVNAIIKAITASGGELSQDVLRKASGSYQVIQWALGEMGLAHKVARGKRQVWQLTMSLDETIARLQAMPEGTEILRPKSSRGRSHKAAAERAESHYERYHWMVEFDPLNRFSEFARFGDTALKDNFGHPRVEWVVEGLTLKHDVTGEQICFYQGRFQTL